MRGKYKDNDVDLTLDSSEIKSKPRALYSHGRKTHRFAVYSQLPNKVDSFDTRVSETINLFLFIEIPTTQVEMFNQIAVTSFAR